MKCRKKKDDKSRQLRQEEVDVNNSNNESQENSYSDVDDLQSQFKNEDKNDKEYSDLKIETKAIFKLSMTFCLLWFVSNYFYNYGLAFASVTSSVILSNTSPMWVYLISLSCVVPAAMREKFDWIKGCMILLSLGGFIVIAIQDWKDDTNTDQTGAQQALGDGFTLISAMCYGFYATFLKVKVPPE